MSHATKAKNKHTNSAAPKSKSTTREPSSREFNLAVIDTVQLLADEMVRPDGAQWDPESADFAERVLLSYAPYFAVTRFGSFGEKEGREVATASLDIFLRYVRGQLGAQLPLAQSFKLVSVVQAEMEALFECHELLITKIALASQLDERAIAENLVDLVGPGGVAEDLRNLWLQRRDGFSAALLTVEIQAREADDRANA